MSEEAKINDLSPEMKLYKYNRSLGRVLGWLFSDKGSYGEHCVELRFFTVDKYEIDTMRHHIYDLIPKHKYELTEHQGRTYTTLKSRYLHNVIDECGLGLDQFITFIGYASNELRIGFLQAYFTAMGCEATDDVINVKPRKSVGKSASVSDIEQTLLCLSDMLSGFWIDSLLLDNQLMIVDDDAKNFKREIGFI